VPEDASLDAFASTGDDETDDESSDPAETDPESPDSESDDAPTAEETDPAVSTYRWSPAGGECADCGETAPRRWRADGERDGALVCADCKEW
jgi:hypothetical protein